MVCLRKKSGGSELNKMVLKYVIIVILCLLIGYSLGVTSSNISEYQEKIDALTSQISSLQDELDKKLSLITDLQSQIENKDAAIQKAQIQITNLQSQLQEKESEIQRLQSQLTEKDHLISSLQDQNLDLKQQLNLRVLGVYFSPKGECEEQILYWINRANVSIHILIYSFTRDSISNALIEAYRRGVDVKVVFERQQITRYSEYQKLKAAGVPVRNDTNPKLMHNKIMIVDGIIVITGSYNYSTSAEEYNNENIIIILSDYIAGIYEKEFEKIWNEST
jgi:phosphatidylserine/phosphatidylglycerophosphate/cardiolipin synthase-like enzyme